MPGRGADKNINTSATVFVFNMADTLSQRRFFINRRHFELTENGISVRESRLTGGSEIFLGFEESGVKMIKSKNGKRAWLVASLCLVVLSAGLFLYEKSGGDVDKSSYIVYLILAAIALIIYLSTYKNSFFLADNDNKHAIKFYVNNPSKEALDLFISEFKSARKNYLVKKYGNLTKHLSYEQQLNTLQWLHHAEGLTNDEYDQKVQELDELFNPKRPTIGFQRNSE